jgi:putative transposase
MTISVNGINAAYGRQPWTPWTDCTEKKARAATPSYGIIDSQSTKTQYASEERGIDGGKLVKGRKRHIVVDTLGDVLHVQVHAANVPDTKAGCAVLQRTAEKYPSLQAFYGDAGYWGTAVSFVEQTLGLTLHIVTKLGEGFTGRWQGFE